ncbi:hypothetical protein HMPREF9714_02368 [Myroides odoratimimus CCUG 12901]|nr:hypothetical protein HMPREF9714_02368 [Myroides odoratimimus CCUG 12901]EPH13571.1 hypothetical protein HMPREF9713_00518 [Myroides odoratimimus CCUG 12700]
MMELKKNYLFYINLQKQPLRHYKTIRYINKLFLLFTE